MSTSERQPGTLYRVVAPHFVAGFIADGPLGHRRIIEAAPILRWTVGQYWDEVFVWMDRKGWTVKAVTTAKR